MNLSDVTRAYMTDRRVKGYAVGTMRTDARVLRGLYASAGNINTRSLRPQHIDAFWQTQAHLSASSLNLYRSRLAIFFKWCKSRGYISPDSDLLNGSRVLRPDRRDRIYIPVEKFSTFIAEASDERMRVTLALGLYLFTRISETEGLRWQDDLGDKMILWRQKTKELAEIPICAELREELDRWKFHYSAEVGSTVLPRWYIVPQLRSRPWLPGHERVPREYLPLSRAPLGNHVRAELERAGYYRPMEGGHTLRRSGARALYDSLAERGHDRAARTVQAMLGHAKLATTEGYLGIDVDRKALQDLVGGKPMFPAATLDADVVSIRGLDGRDRDKANGV